jgi:hypothetical protein
MIFTMKRWQDWVVLVLGVWLFLSPYFFGYTGAPATNSYVIGLAVTLFAVLALIDSRMWEEWINLALGAWLIISPFVLGFSAQQVATYNHIIVGLLIGADALWMIRLPTMERKRLVHH